MEEILKKIYYDPESPAGYSGALRLFTAAKNQIPGLTIEKVKQFLSKQFAYSLHYQVRKHFKRNKVVALRPLEQMQSDLIELQEYASVNNGFRFILVLIDVFTKKLQACPLKTKSARDVSAALEKLFSVNRPMYLVTDRGREYFNREVKALTDKLHITHFSNQNQEIKACVAERVNRTLKSKLFKYLTAHGTRRWVDVLPKLVAAYNNSYHRAIMTTPNSVDASNTDTVFRNLYGSTNGLTYFTQPSRRPKLKVGDHVRITHDFNVFSKHYLPNWRDKVFTVSQVIDAKPEPLYRIKYKDKIEQKRFYEPELQKVEAPERYRIDKAVKFDRKNKRVLVRWMGYDQDDDSWIDEAAYQPIGHH